MDRQAQRDIPRQVDPEHLSRTLSRIARPRSLSDST